MVIIGIFSTINTMYETNIFNSSCSLWPPTAKYLGGDPTVLGLLALITALSGGIFTTTLIISYDAIAQRIPVCAVITGVLVAVLIFCGIWWYRRFKLSKWDQEGP